jgi:hypothetical protein
MRFNNNAQVRKHAANLAAALSIMTIADRAPTQPIDVCKTCISTGKMRSGGDDASPELFPPAVLGASKTSPFFSFCVVCREAITEYDG